jgi:7,8-dihydropterin-6-yl-methyl-4-(beta-D-ribofuranosyl)aminobenzene 5'-phosphate synthase
MRWWKAAAVLLALPALLPAEPLLKLSPFGSVWRLTMVPLAESQAESSKFAAEPGVSYLIRADNINILMDTGLNPEGEHPSPLLRNMQTLGVDPGRIGLLFFSRVDPSHVGGLREFSISRGPVPLLAIPAFSPAPLKPSRFNPEPGVQVLDSPLVLGSGIASLGPLRASKNVVEQVLAINVERKGIVLFSGSGHLTLEAMLKRTREIFSEPIYGIVGALRLGDGGANADRTIQALKKLDLQFLAISPHHASEEVIERLKAEFGDRYHEIKVGRELSFSDSWRPF